jgi:hypothetical protein
MPFAASNLVPAFIATVDIVTYVDRFSVDIRVIRLEVSITPLTGVLPPQMILVVSFLFKRLATFVAFVYHPGYGTISS